MRSRKPRAEPAKGRNATFQNQPFRRLAGLARSAAPPQPLVPPPPPEAPLLSEADLFQREMSGVRQFADALPSRVPQARPAQSPREVVDPDAEALAELSDLVTGVGAFDITNTTEYIEGAVIGLDRRLVRRLRAGEFVVQSHLDLHGLAVADARVAVDQFLLRAHRRGYRCVLIIHGRGLNSAGQNPVLKKHLANWLSHGSHARLVLAFTSARPCDGGAGAVYVLLRRERTSKRPLRVTEGSKS
jgi:DNA-nicking Smr family endonuclease